MPSCEEIRHLLRREIRTADLSSEEFALLDEHVDACHACHELLHAEDPLALFTTLRESRRDPVLWTGFWDGVRGEIEDEAPAWSLPAFLRPAYVVAAAATLVLAVGLVALVGLQEFPGSPEHFPGIVEMSVPPSFATVESIGSTSARIYDMQVIDEENQVTELVMIFDEEIDL